jgi:hypothetical protein
VTAIGVSTGGNTVGDTGTTQGTYVLAGGNQITLSQATAPGGLATVTISGRDAVFGAGVSTGGNTVGDTGTRTGTFVLVGGANITLSQATAIGGATVTISAGAGGGAGVTAIGVSTGGNTLGDTGTTQGTYVLAGAGIITLSQATAPGALATVTISASQSVQPGVTAIGVSTGGNTAGTTGTTQGTYILVGGNQITLSQSTAAGSLATVTISARDAVFGAGVSTGGNSVGDTGTRTGTFVLAGGNGITLSQATAAGGATVTISGITQSVQPGVTAIGVSTGGNTAGTTGTTQGTYVLAGGNNITLSQSTAAGSLATVTISAANSGTVVSGIGVSTGGNTAGDTGTTIGTVVFAGGNQITLSQSTAAGSLATITVSGRDAVFGAGVSTGGNTSGDTGTRTGTIVFAGGANITLSQSTAAGGATITISGGAGGGTVVSGIGVSTGGNTAGDTGTRVGTVVFAGAGAVTLSQATAAGSSATITISVPVQSVQPGVTAIGVSTGGNTAGTTGTTQGTYVLAGGNNITLSQSTAAGSLATVTISGAAQATGSLFQHPQADWHATNFTISNATFSLQKASFPAYMTATRLQLLMDLTGNSGSSGALTISIGAYTLSGSTASLSTSASRQISWTSGSDTSASSRYGGVSGTRYRTLEWNVTMTPGDYLFGVWFRTTNNGTWRAFGPQAVSIVGALDAAETNVFLDGTSVSSFTTAMPVSIDVTNASYARTGAAALRQPGFLLAGTI